MCVSCRLSHNGQEGAGVVCMMMVRKHVPKLLDYMHFCLVFHYSIIHV